MVRIENKDMVFLELDKQINDDIYIENIPLLYTLEESIYVLSAAIKALRHGHTLTIKMVNVPKKLHSMLIGPFEAIYELMNTLFTIDGEPLRCFYTRLMLEHAFSSVSNTIIEDEESFTIICKK